jgi:hypothetical protein
MRIYENFVYNRPSAPKRIIFEDHGAQQNAVIKAG